MERTAANRNDRALAKIADAVLLCWLAYQLTEAWFVWYNAAVSGVSQVQIVLDYWTALLVFALLLMVTLKVVFLSLWGATPGKLLLGLQVVKVDGDSLGIGGSLKRSVAELLSVLAIGIGYLAPEGQTWHDKMSGTTVTAAVDKEPRHRLGIVIATWIFAAGLGIRLLAPILYSWTKPH